jgi:hypothetical protein
MLVRLEYWRHAVRSDCVRAPRTARVGGRPARGQAKTCGAALRGGRGAGQEIAAFTSSATFFSTMGLHFLSAYDTGHTSPAVEVRRFLEAQGRVAVAELARVLEEDDDLAIRVRVSGPGLAHLQCRRSGLRVRCSDIRSVLTCTARSRRRGR